MGVGDVEVDYEGLAKRANLLCNTASPIINTIMNAYDKFNNDMKESWFGHSYDELAKTWDQTRETMYKVIKFMAYTGPYELYLKAKQYAKRDGNENWIEGFYGHVPAEIPEFTLTKKEPKLRFLPEGVQTLREEISGDFRNAQEMIEVYKEIVRDTKKDWESASADKTCDLMLNTSFLVGATVSTMDSSIVEVVSWQMEMIKKNEQANMDVKAGKDITDEDVGVPETLFNKWKDEFEPWCSWDESLGNIDDVNYDRIFI